MNYTGTAFGSGLNLAPGAFNMASSGFSGGGGGLGGLLGSLNPMQMAGMLGVGNFGASMMGQEAAGASGQAALDTMATLRDIDFGGDVFATNKEIFEQRDMPRFFDQYRANNPFYRQNQARAALPELAGRYGRFGAFVS